MSLLDNINKRSINVQATQVYQSYDKESGQIAPAVNVRKISFSKDGKADFGNSIENNEYARQLDLNATTILNADGSRSPKPYSGTAEYVAVEAALVPIPPIASALGRAAAAGRGRVFWSGGEGAMNAAMEYAQANGMTTLEMTRAGQNLAKLTKGIPWEQAKPMWERLSAAYAKGAKGPVHVFQRVFGEQ